MILNESLLIERLKDLGHLDLAKGFLDWDTCTCLRLVLLQHHISLSLQPVRTLFPVYLRVLEWHWRFLLIQEYILYRHWFDWYSRQIGCFIKLASLVSHSFERRDSTWNFSDTDFFSRVSPDCTWYVLGIIAFEGWWWLPCGFAVVDAEGLCWTLSSPVTWVIA